MIRLQDISRSSWWIGVLVLLNLTTISLLWLGHPPKKGPPPSIHHFLEKELQLDQQQIAQIEALQETHRAEQRQNEQELREARKNLFQALAAKEVDDAVVIQLQSELLTKQEAMNQSMADHFLELKVICTPEQQQKLGEIFIRALRPPPGPGHRGGPPPPK